MSKSHKSNELVEVKEDQQIKISSFKPTDKTFARNQKPESQDSTKDEFRHPTFKIFQKEIGGVTITSSYEFVNNRLELTAVTINNPLNASKVVKIKYPDDEEDRIEIGRKTKECSELLKKFKNKSDEIRTKIVITVFPDYKITEQSWKEAVTYNIYLFRSRDRIKSKG